jgi:hypothetical protein
MVPLGDTKIHHVAYENFWGKILLLFKHSFWPFILDGPKL